MSDLPKSGGDQPACLEPVGSVFLSIDRCPVHGEFWAISLDHDTGGTRLTNGKCCGRWKRFKAWKMTPDRLRELANLFDQEADDLERKMEAAEDSPNK